MQVCLINPPQPNSLDDRLDVPLGLLYIAAGLREMNIEVRIADLSSRPRNEWSSLIGYADVYGIGVYTCAYPLAREIQKICKNIHPQAMVAVGGAHPTAEPQECLQDFDVVFRGEADVSFLKWIKERENGKRLYDFDIPQQLDLLPLPARDLVDLKSYHRVVGGELATSLITSRGCPFGCAFCTSKAAFRKVRFRSIEKVIEEMEGIIHHYGIRNYLFYDDTFAINRRRLYPLLKEIGRLNIKFRCNGWASYNTLEDFVRLKEAGCVTIAFGIESGSQKILDRVNKKTTVEKNKQAIINAKKAGIRAKAYLMIGLPGENAETIEETKRFIEEARPDEYTLFTFVPLPGSDIWENAEKYGVRLLNADYSQYYVIAGQGEGGITVETDSYTADELRKMREDLLQYLSKLNWEGDRQSYFDKVKWR